MPQWLPTLLRLIAKTLTASPQAPPQLFFLKQPSRPLPFLPCTKRACLRVFAFAAPTVLDAFLLDFYLVHFHFAEIFANTNTSSLWPLPLLYFSFWYLSPSDTRFLCRPLLLEHKHHESRAFALFISVSWGPWVAQAVKRPTSAQVMISQFLGLSPVLGSVLTAQSLEPASDSVSLLSLSKINKH